MPGTHTGDNMDRWGYRRLRYLLEREPAISGDFRRAPVAVQTSSLGSLDDRWLTGEFLDSLAAGTCSVGGGHGAGGPSQRACMHAERHQQQQRKDYFNPCWLILAPYMQKHRWGGLQQEMPACRWCGQRWGRCNLAWRGGRRGRAFQARQHAWTGLSCSNTIAGATASVCYHLCFYLHLVICYYQAHACAHLPTRNAHELCRWGGEVVGRERAMPHIKSMVRYNATGDVAWMYMGSHNLSKAGAS